MRICATCGKQFQDDPMVIRDRLRIIAILAPYFRGHQSYRETRQETGFSPNTISRYFKLFRLTLAKFKRLPGVHEDRSIT
jgi:uncharacterized protein YerC